MRIICWLFGHRTFTIECPQIPEIPTWVCCDRCGKTLEKVPND